MAKILGISPAYLSLLINGKRQWRGGLKKRYETLVNREEMEIYSKNATNNQIVTNTDRWWSWGGSNSLPLQTPGCSEEWWNSCLTGSTEVD